MTETLEVGRVPRPRTPAQQANDARLRQQWSEYRDAKEGPDNLEPVSMRQSFLARHKGQRRNTIETPEDIEVAGQDGRRGVRTPLGSARNLAGRITIEHETDARVKMWKPGPHGWIGRAVPVHAIGNNLANGWLEYCPDCRGMELDDGTVLTGTECDTGASACPAKQDRKFVTCPVPTCNQDTGGPKRIYATGLGYQEAADRANDPNEVSPYRTLDVMAELKAKMDQHILRAHGEEARMLGIADLAPRGA